MKPGSAARLVAVCGLLLCLQVVDAAGKELAPARNAPVAAQPNSFPEKAALAPEKGRTLAFNRQNVFMYFRQVNEAKNKLPEEMPYAERRDRQCHVYADVLKQTGYDFEATVLNAVENAEKGGNRLDDPRFTFLAGVFQEHPDNFLRLRLISKATRDAVVRFFGN